MKLKRVILATVTAYAVLSAAPAYAQTSSNVGPAGAAEFSIGYAGFLDDAFISHTLVGGSARWYLSPRVAVGPEIVYMIGPGDDRDLLVTGNLTFDLLAPSPLRRRAIVPYFVAGGGLFQHRDRFGPLSFTSTEGAFTAGGGARAWVSRKAYVAGEARLGWEAHVRYSAHLGLAFGQ